MNNIKYLFNEDELPRMNDAYNVSSSWPHHTLIGLDGGGNGLFICNNGKSGIFRMQMGCPMEPEFLCNSIDELNDVIQNDFNSSTPIDIYNISITLKSAADIIVIRTIQEAFGLKPDPISKIKRFDGESYIIYTESQRCVIEKVLSRIQIKIAYVNFIKINSAQQGDAPEPATIVDPASPSSQPPAR